MGTRSTKIVGIIGGIIGVCAAVFFSISVFGRPSLPKQTPQSLVFSGGKRVFVEVADSEATRTKGLSDRASLPQDTGLYFIFPRKDRYAFWMKSMMFPIDIVWIWDGEVVQIDHAPVEAVDPPVERYNPPVPVDRVLEIPAGKAHEWEIAVGSTVREEY